MAFYKEAGLSNFEVLKTATINAANTHDIMNNMGSIEDGKVANLILIDSDPLADLSALKNPSAVFIKGRKLDSESLENFKNETKNRSNLIVSALRYAENLIIEK
jgi:imidazolonepropionase-like amidohydrolase